MASPHDRIPCVLEADDTMRRDVIAMHHAFGGLPDEEPNSATTAAMSAACPPTRIRPDHRYPRQGNIPVRVTPGFETGEYGR